ncbi:hypothetical protein BU17DRAFT_68111 [Hysterangium stoloniferum]|nr:hypothetical protein BU17DRAFT_68111 [Hysterangium stoloniferum]
MSTPLAITISSLKNLSNAHIYNTNHRIVAASTVTIWDLVLTLPDVVYRPMLELVVVFGPSCDDSIFPDSNSSLLVVAFYERNKYIFVGLVALFILCNIAALSMELIILPKSAVINVQLPAETHMYICAFLQVDKLALLPRVWRFPKEHNLVWSLSSSGRVICNGYIIDGTSPLVGSATGSAGRLQGSYSTFALRGQPIPQDVTTDNP